MREYVVVFLVAMAVSYLLTVVAREIALRTGAVARVRDRDVHDEPIPYLGANSAPMNAANCLPRSAAIGCKSNRHTAPPTFDLNRLKI